MDFKRLERALKFAAERTHADFLSHLQENPADHTSALAYADWLEEQGHPGASQLIQKSIEKGNGLYETRSFPIPSYSHHTRGQAHYQPAVDIYTTLPNEDGDKTYITRFMSAVPPSSHGSFDATDYHAGFTHRGTAEDTHALVSTMGDIPGAKQAQEELESRHRWLKKTPN